MLFWVLREPFSSYLPGGEAGEARSEPGEVGGEAGEGGGEAGEAGEEVREARGEAGEAGVEAGEAGCEIDEAGGEAGATGGEAVEAGGEANEAISLWQHKEVPPANPQQQCRVLGSSRVSSSHLLGADRRSGKAVPAFCTVASTLPWWPSSSRAAEHQ